MKPSADEIALREAKQADVGPLLDLWRSADAVPGVTDTAADVSNVIEVDCARVLVAEVGGHLVGSVIATFDGWRGNIYRLAVHPEFRRRALATRLLDTADGWLREKGAKRVTALVVQAHPWAVGFWDASDFLFDERTVRYVRTL